MIAVAARTRDPKAANSMWQWLFTSTSVPKQLVLYNRTRAFAFAADKRKKAFLHVKLYKPDRDSTRFLWLRISTTLQVIWRLNALSSPFMLNATLDSTNFLHRWLKTKANLYVDNLISGCNSEKEAIHYYRQAQSILCEPLRSWSSSSRQLYVITSEDQTNDPIYLAYTGIP